MLEVVGGGVDYMYIYDNNDEWEFMKQIVVEKMVVKMSMSFV